jgi:hypothetical protein
MVLFQLPSWITCAPQPMANVASLDQLLSSSLVATVAFAILLGVVAHLAIRPHEIDSRAWPIFSIYLGVLIALFATYSQIAGFSILTALIRTIVVGNSFNVGLASSILVYRGFFHRLHRFPGPFLAKLTRFYAMKKAAKNLQAMKDIQSLHAAYGDFVRVGMSVHS